MINTPLQIRHFLGTNTTIHLSMNNAVIGRINIGPGVFILSATAAMFITLLTISFQAIRAAVANPVKSLRTE